ncbi:MFS transporter [Baia soyae]|uniref:Sugar phosphate permease n=1 Tax=Baia soyae TaxID=1544746 RepID=A0A4R2S1D8_9BACL|nr:MFS transporter [Baia soyae]TCP69850.1 sugar phosphate permease [Baia soyae]
MIEVEHSAVQSYIDSPSKLRKLYKRVLIIISLSQIFGGAGLAAGVTVGALIAQQMLGTDAFAGLPAALFTLGSGGAAFLVGRLSQRSGRRVGLATGFMVGGLGAVGVVVATMIGSIVLLLISLLVYGAGTATNLQARYAGTDLANKKQRATAISITMVMTTFGAVAGPNLVDIMGRFAVSIGIPKLAGPFILSAFAFFMAGLVLYIMLRPDPLEIARKIESYKQKYTDEVSSKSEDIPADKKRGITIGATVMVLTQMVMVGIMTMTPIHMQHHGHGLGEIGMVIAFHIGSMYLPSLFTGILVDKIGRVAMSIASGVTLLISALVAAFSPSDSVPLLIVALSLLGLGWNFGLISGTAQIVDSAEPKTRAKVQGTVDVFVALAGASGGALSGMIVANSSYATLSLLGGVLSLLLIPVILWPRNRR